MIFRLILFYSLMLMSYYACLRDLKKQLAVRKPYVLFIPVLLSGCFGDASWGDAGATLGKRDDPAPGHTITPNAATDIFYGTRTIDWDQRAHDVYALDEAVADFGNIRYGWQEEKTFNSAGTCRIKLLKDTLSAACGMISKVLVPPGSEYELQFDVKFHSAFDWSKGGKVGFGFSIGEGYSGCNPGWSGDGGTFRLVWYNDNNEVYFQPYAYYKDQPQTCGDKFGKRFPATGSLVKGRWYTVKLYIKSNTGSLVNGRIGLTINDTVVLDQAIRWTTNDSKRLIDAIYFSTFRGGNDPAWESATDGYIYFDNLSWAKLD